ncbi:MAG: hypothetical protein H6737_20590 [Alphaproteobacteria bacterium]|nr:hypothetical protein [Alphaproteobacteria bacterium]
MTAMQSVTAALEGVASWRSEQEARRQAEIVDVDSQLEKLRADLAELQGKITSLEAFRGQLEERDASEGVVARSYDAIFAALLGQAAQLDTRAAEASEATAKRNQAVLDGLSKGELAPLVQEYNQFKTQVEPTLQALPESYRGAIIEHHHGIVDRIRAHLEDQIAGPAVVEGDRVELELVYGIDAPSGTPELLICVLPVKDVTFTDWAERPEDLSTHLGARAVQAIYEATKQGGLPGAQAVFGGHQGLLAVEVDLEGVSKDFAQLLADSFNAVLKSAPELAAGKLGLTARKVDFDFLLPPEIEDDEEEEG